MTDNGDVKLIRLFNYAKWLWPSTSTHPYTRKVDWTSTEEFEWCVAFIRGDGYKFPHDPSHSHGDKKPRYYDIRQGERCDTYWVIWPFTRINQAVKPGVQPRVEREPN